MARSDVLRRSGPYDPSVWVLGELLAGAGGPGDAAVGIPREGVTTVGFLQVVTAAQGVQVGRTGRPEWPGNDVVNVA